MTATDIVNLFIMAVMVVTLALPVGVMMWSIAVREYYKARDTVLNHRRDGK